MIHALIKMLLPRTHVGRVALHNQFIVRALLNNLRNEHVEIEKLTMLELTK
jgi:hypothetical protein